MVVEHSGNYFLLYPSKVFNSPHTPRDGVWDRRTPIKVALLTYQFSLLPVPVLAHEYRKNEYSGKSVSWSVVV